jgi:Zn-dependent protease
MQSITIASIRGIDVRIHPSFALVLLWVVYHFGIARGGGLGAIVYGLLLMVLVFLCVLAHEFGHAVMAQEQSVRVRNITLIPFGGAAFIEQMPLRPRAELAITLAGPAVNVAIAVTLFPFILLYGVARGYDSVGDYVRYFDNFSAGGLLIYLFFANLMILLFNLIPAFPMDGGRVLRALLSTVAGREAATSIAVVLGMSVALTMLIAGIWMGDLMLPAIAIFVLITAYGEAKSVRLEGALRRLRVGQFALWDSGGITAQHPIASALRGGPRDMVVTDHGRVVGMLWRHDVLNALNGGLSGRSVGDVMDHDVVAVDIEDSVFDVQQQMQRLNRWAVPVTDGGIYRGIFTVDRFVHVYRYLDAQSPDRRFAGLAETVGAALRGGAR